MGQDHSVEARPPPTHEEVVRHLAGKFADKCYTPLEIYSLKDNFKSLADTVQDVKYLKDDTVARFLEIPDALRVTPVLFQSVSYLAAFPFLRDAPAVLGLEQLVIAITILTGRWKRVLKSPADRTKLLFKSLAVYDRKLSRATLTPVASPTAAEAKGASAGFAVDEAGDDDEAEDDGDDDLVLAAFESLDCVDAFRHGDAPPKIQGAMIPADNFVRLIMLLLLVAPLDPQERLSQYSDRLVGTELEDLHATAQCVVQAFLDVEEVPGLTWSRFRKILPVCCPFMFDAGFNALFSHFLFSKNIDFNKRKPTGSEEDRGEQPKLPQKATPSQSTLPQPLLPQAGSILNANILSQLSFFIPGDSLFRCLRLLYSGDEDGFSMGSFESKVFNWRAPTLLLVRGRRLDDHPDGTRESAFAASIPPRRFPNGGGGGTTENSDEIITFGAFIAQPWRHTHRECFGDDSSVLFQLGPVHDVFRASTLNRDYAGFVKPTGSGSSNHHGGIMFGCPAPSPSKASSATGALVALGSVSLFLDSSFEFGVFTHDHTSRGGAYAGSTSRPRNFQERFAVDCLEVWGCGGDEESKRQAERWAWEAREAEARRKINLGTGDLEADRALLEMAGLVGQNRSGGSMI
ncbi:Restriction of telomere capping protein 5 [Pyricularia oryzae]|uniref:Restriction of telomere capping protein 5 n=1 Tax=Pyricularia grisea TaxID=148305 RepID=A0ABQ8NP10_PYRGI|nr:Restriction of telomere capping protein 5 [Pyricularia oryzae]KAI6300016.1 Restriction of telomere capping protein 5 [Pyricularia grisea]KAI6259587.1 Restriction of telomere capping protein 5 [Pyricularia oryzae]KAI6278575.1 Restriction of telomere capping protein 5 [Pyricularia oryzae]KAI6283869.1 Restriction of telomere capping protein 5 [Pyricularia oryzae]